MQPHIQRMRQHIQRMQSPHTTNATIHTTNATRRQQMQLGRQRMQPRRQQPSCFVRAKNSFCFELPLTVLSVLVHCIRIVDHFVLLVDWPLLTLEEQFQLSCGEIKMSHAISLSLDFDVLLSHLRLTFFHFQNISYASQVVSPSIPPRFSSVSSCLFPSPSISRYFYIYLSIYLCMSVCLAVPFSMSLSLSVSLFLSVALWCYLCISPILSLSLMLGLSPSFSASLYFISY